MIYIFFTLVNFHTNSLKKIVYRYYLFNNSKLFQKLFFICIYKYKFYMYIVSMKPSPVPTSKEQCFIYFHVLTLLFIEWIVILYPQCRTDFICLFLQSKWPFYPFDRLSLIKYWYLSRNPDIHGCIEPRV